MRLDVPGVLDDIVIIFIYDDPTLLEIAETSPPTLDVGNFQANPPHLRRLRGDCQKDEVRISIARATDCNDNTDRPLFSSFGLTTLLLPRPEIGIGYYLTGTKLMVHRQPSPRANRSIASPNSSACSSGISEMMWARRGSLPLRMRS